MASPSCKKNYPHLLYKKNKAPSQQKSMCYYSYLSKFQIVKVGLGIDAWDAVKNSAVGVFPRFYERRFIWCAKVVHHLLMHQLWVKKNYELWSLIDCLPIRLSLIEEFGVITRMNCDLFQNEENFDVDHREFWTEMGVSTAVGPNLVELRSVLERCKDWSVEKRTMVGLLCVLHLSVYGIAPTRRIPLQCEESSWFFSFPEIFVGSCSLSKFGTFRKVCRLHHKGILYHWRVHFYLANMGIWVGYWPRRALRKQNCWWKCASSFMEWLPTLQVWGLH